MTYIHQVSQENVRIQTFFFEILFFKLLLAGPPPREKAEDLYSKVLLANKSGSARRNMPCLIHTV